MRLENFTFTIHDSSSRFTIYHSPFTLHLLTMGNRLLIIINNAAAKAGGAWPVIKAKLQQNKLRYDVYETTRPGDATIKTRAALEAGFSTIAVVGGDGTLSEAAEGFFEFDNAG